VQAQAMPEAAEVWIGRQAGLGSTSAALSIPAVDRDVFWRGSFKIFKIQTITSSWLDAIFVS
jgi:hypothetical protein